MRFSRCLLSFALLCASSLALAAPTTYTMDPSHTQVRLTWTHFGFSHPSAVVGIDSGTVVYDPAHPERASVKVSMPLSSLDTHVPALDAHLMGADFFDAIKFPVATFTSTDVKALDDTHLAVTGKLSVHGVTQPVTLHVTLNKIGTHPGWKAPAIGFDATTTLERSAFEVSRYVPVVSDAVKVHITTEAIESGAYAKARDGA